MIAILAALVACGGGAVRDAGAPDRDAEADAASIDGAAPADAAAGTATGHAAWPVPGPDARLAVSGALARDAVTGLFWEREPPSGVVTQADAIARCDALVLEGRDDFRLPTRIEWVSILDPTMHPTLDVAAFPSAIPEYHWTASASALAAGSAFSVYLGGGETTVGIAARASAIGRCVAGGALLEGVPFEVLDADRARHRGTGLVWARAHLAAAPHADAAAACTALGARLPTLRELQSIVEEQRVDPALDDAVFPGAIGARHWTSTIRDAGELLPWTVDFHDGQTYAEDPASTRHAARCVW